MGRKITEPWISHVVALTVLVSLMGGIPIYLARTAGNAPALLWLFPALAAAITAVRVVQLVKAGFVVSPQGLEGAHDLDKGERIPWEQLSAFEWELKRSSSNSDHEGGTRQTYRLHAITDRGGVRVTSLAASARTARKLTGQLAEAREQGMIPPHVEIHRPLTAGELLRTMSSAAGMQTPPHPRATDVPPGTSSPLGGSGGAPDTALPPPPQQGGQQGPNGPAGSRGPS